MHKGAHEPPSQSWERTGSVQETKPAAAERGGVDKMDVEISDPDEVYQAELPVMPVVAADAASTTRFPRSTVPKLGTTTMCAKRAW